MNVSLHLERALGTGLHGIRHDGVLPILRRTTLPNFRGAPSVLTMLNDGSGCLPSLCVWVSRFLGS